MPSTVGIFTGSGWLKNKTEAKALGYKINYVTNPSFETDLTNWSAVAGSTLTRDTSIFRTGAASMRVTNLSTSAAQFGGTTRVPLIAGEGSYTLSAYVRLASGNSSANYYIRQLQYETAASPTTVAAGNGGFQSLSFTGNWVRLTYTFTKNAAANYLIFRVVTDSTTATDVFYVDSVALEYSGLATSYFDGASDGFWIGTEGSSYSGGSPYS